MGGAGPAIAAVGATGGAVAGGAQRSRETEPASGRFTAA
jgi:hypothetical protein